MPLQRQNIAVPFAQGADSRLDDFILPPGKLTVLQNGYLTASGTVRKRPGNVSLGSASSSGQGITAYRSELVVMDSTKLYSYAPSLLTFQPKGTLFSCAVTTKPIIRASGNFTLPDQATNTTTGLQLVTYFDGTTIRYSILDTTTGQVLVDRQQLISGGTSAKPIACGSYLVAVVYDGTTALKFIPFAGTTAGSAVNISGTSFNTGAVYYDVAILPGLLGSDPIFCVAWNSTDVGGGIRAQAYSATTLTGFGSTLTVETGHAASAGLALIPDTSGSTQRFIVAYNDGANIRVVSFNGNVTAGGGIADQSVVAAASNTIVVGASFNTSGTSTGRIFWTSQAAADHSTDSVQWASWSGNVFTSRGAYVLGWGLASKPFVQNGLMHITVYFDPDKTSYTGQQPTYMVLTDGQQTARLFYGIGGGRAAAIAPEAQQVGTGQFVLPFTFRDLLTTVPASPNLNSPPLSGSLPSYVYSTKGVSCVTLNFFNVQSSYSSAELADSLHIGGGQLMQYDGTQVVEHGFNLYPEGITVSLGAGGVLTAGTYVWYAVYEWTDAQGRIHQSAPSPGVQMTATANQAATITLPTYRLGAKAGTVNIVVYRTIANNLVPFRVGTVANNAGANTVTFTDNTVTDTNLSSAPPIGTLGSVTENIPLGPCQSLVIYKNRIAAILSEDPLSVAYSKQVLPGAPVEFNPDEFVFRVDPIGGALTALGVMDDKLILFKQDRILFTAGDGPDPTGQSGSFADPAVITTDCGCTDPRSVVTTPNGLMFRGRKGIYLLDRGLRVTPIGLPALGTLDGSTVVSSTLSPLTQQVRFGLSDNQTVLVYDYLNDQWGWYTNPELASVGACIYNSAYTYLQPSGVVGQESQTVFTDFGNFIPLVVETGWFNVADLNGFVRLYAIELLARWKSSHLLKVSLAYDNVETYVASGTLDARVGSQYGQGTWGGNGGTWGGGTTYGGTGDGSLTARFDPARQKCRTFKVRIEDQQNDALYGESLQLTGMTLQVGAKAGLGKLPAAKQVGVS